MDLGHDIFVSYLTIIEINIFSNQPNTDTFFVLIAMLFRFCNLLVHFGFRASLFLLYHLDVLSLIKYKYLSAPWETFKRFWTRWTTNFIAKARSGPIKMSEVCAPKWFFYGLYITICRINQNENFDSPFGSFIFVINFEWHPFVKTYCTLINGNHSTLFVKFSENFFWVFQHIFLIFFLFW